MEDAWLISSETHSLKEGEIHVWRASLDQNDLSAAALLNILSPDEKHRSDKFRFDADRSRFIISRGILRKILSGYLHKSPKQICFSYGNFGKPALIAGGGLSFNLSHSQGLALYAVTRNREIGIDVESINENVAIERIAKKVLTQSETLFLNALTPRLRPVVFYRFWTRREAFVKASGKGLFITNDKTPVSLEVRKKEWSLFSLPVTFGYAAAVAAEGSVSNLRCWQYPNLDTDKKAFNQRTGLNTKECIHKSVLLSG